MSGLTLSESFARLRQRVPDFRTTLSVDAHSINVGVISIAGRFAMNAILVLLAVSALVGFILGVYFRWVAILVSGLILSMLAATVLQNEGFGFLAGIAIIVVCLTVNQIAYLIGAALVTRGPKDQ